MKIHLFLKKLSRAGKTLYSRIQRDQLRETASSLTYQTVLALVPLLAIILGVAKGFSLDTLLVDVLKQRFTDHQQILDYLLKFSKTALEQMKSGVIAGLGIIFLLITTTNLLFTAENLMNRMWGAIKGRSLARRIADFQSCIFLFPLLIVMGSSATIFIQTTLCGWSEAKHVSLIIAPIFLYGARLIPLVLLWALFTLCYWLIPNVHIQKTKAVLTAFVITILFHSFQLWYIDLQLTLTKTSVIYGSFAALPLFLVWVWTSWFIFLLGAELLVFLHEKGWKEKCQEWNDTNEGENLLLTVSLFQDIVQRYKNGEICLLADYVQTHEAPFHTISSIINLLKERHLVYFFTDEKKELRVVPSNKSLHCGLGDIILPLSDSLSSPDKETLESWKKLLNITSVD